MSTKLDDLIDEARHLLTIQGIKPMPEPKKPEEPKKAGEPSKSDDDMVKAAKLWLTKPSSTPAPKELPSNPQRSPDKVKRVFNAATDTKYQKRLQKKRDRDMGRK